MSSVEWFEDYSGGGAAADENTILADYWLNFVAARQEGSEPKGKQTPARAQQLYFQVREFNDKVDALLFGRNQIRSELQRFAQKSGLFWLDGAASGRDKLPWEEPAEDKTSLDNCFSGSNLRTVKGKRT